MSKNTKKNLSGKGRRNFLKTVAMGAGAAGLSGATSLGSGREQGKSGRETYPSSNIATIQYPRVYEGNKRKMIAFPLGGIGSGSISLGGRGQLHEWWIFNRPDKGKSPEYAFPSIWVRKANRDPVAKVLEARILPPYEGPSGLGSANVPGLPRLESSTFSAEFPLANVDFQDSEVSLKVSLEAFTPFIPLNADDSGLPVAVLRYRVRNPSATRASVSIAFSIDNPVGESENGGAATPGSQGRVNEYRKAAGIEGLLMRNPLLSKADPLAGTFALALLGVGSGKASHLRGWPNAQWWESPLLFWDDFSSDGELGPEASVWSTVGSLCLKREIAPFGDAEFAFLLAWHFPNRTPKRCGWRSPKGHEDDLIGNYYCTRFADAWAVAEYVAVNLPRLESQTREFAAAIRETTLPGAVKDAATSTLSALVAPTCFRTADGSFHGFEGCHDHSGCCFGNCTHVWNYEAATASLFPSLSRSLREQQFSFLTDEEGRMDFRELLPFGLEHYGFAAADGQMGTIIKLYHDWKLCGDLGWLKERWPVAKRALEFAWIKGGWDANRDGVMEGAQHNTYDVEFIGPNPLCGTWYLGALRAGEEMACAAGDGEAADEYQRLFRNGSAWMDQHLFNGEYYVQKVGGVPEDQIAKGLLAGSGPEDTEHPDFQVGQGCLTDQLVGQYFAQVAGLGLLLDRDHILKTLHSIYKYNYKRDLSDHISVQRTFALNDEAGLVICTYPGGERPQAPFPYFAEVMTGMEYGVAALMFYMGMTSEGLELVESVRRRYDGEKRNPWDEPEAGYYYVRPMASWASFLALSGFRYDGVRKHLEIKPRIHQEKFVSFWTAPGAWGTYTQDVKQGIQRLSILVRKGRLACHSLALVREKGSSLPTTSKVGKQILPLRLQQKNGEAILTFPKEIWIEEGMPLVLSS